MTAPLGSVSNPHPASYDLVVTITGVSGFVGSHLARRLLNETRYNIRVMGADLAPSDRITDLMGRDSFSFHPYDVHQPLHSNLLACDTLYHFAGIANPQTYLEDPVRVMDLNLMGLRNILDRVCTIWPKGGHRPRIVYSSTSEVYGRNTAVPFDEFSTDLLFGQTNVRRWSYAMTKAVGEHYLQAYGEDQGVPYTIFRFFNFVGPDVDAPGAGRVITRMAGDGFMTGQINVVHPGTQTRCFTWIEDALDALVLPSRLKLEREGFRNENHVLNLGSDEETTMLDLAHKIKRELEKWGAEDIEVVNVSAEQIYGRGGYDDVQRRVPATVRAKEQLGWEARMGIDSFLPQIVAACVKRMRTAEGQAAEVGG